VQLRRERIDVQPLPVALDRTVQVTALVTFDAQLDRFLGVYGELPRVLAFPLGPGQDPFVVFQCVQRGSQAAYGLLVKFVDGFALQIEIQFSDVAVQAFHRE